MSSNILTFKSPLNHSRFGSQQNSTKEVLREMYCLLEEYAPIWYSEDLHNRVVAALGGPNSIGAVGSPSF
jgi:hypothetical protein